MATIKTKNGKVVLKNGKASCTCCNPCGCSTVLISEPLLSTLRNATTGTCNGVSPMRWNSSGGGFDAHWLVNTSTGSTVYTAFLPALQNSALQNCFNLGGDNALNTIHGGPSEGCCSTNPSFPATCADTTFTINGQSFIAHTENYGSGSDVPPPTFVFS